MKKPNNPYRKNTIIWSVMEGDWEDLTASQIAEVLNTTTGIINSTLSKIKRDTGYCVPHAKEMHWKKIQCLNKKG